MDRRRYLVTLASAATVGLAGCTALADVSDEFLGGDEYDIGMSRNEFLPDEYEISVGDTVTWKNTSGADHTVTALEGSLPDDAAYFATGGYEDETTARDAWHAERGGRLGTRETYSHTFEVTGTYDYICEPHIYADMAGTIIVTE